jgi:hypothetical protein
VIGQGGIRRQAVWKSCLKEMRGATPRPSRFRHNFCNTAAFISLFYHVTQPFCTLL